MKKDCRVKEKINELNMSDELKEQIAKIMLNDVEESEEDQNELLDQEGSTSNNENDLDNCESDNCECYYKINMIRAETKLALEMIDKISNEEEKHKYLTKIKNMLLGEQPEESPKSENFVGYDFASILKKAEIQKRKAMVKDLQQEINELKAEIQIIKLELNKLKENDIIQDITLSQLTESSKEEIVISDENEAINRIKILQQKWQARVTLKIGKSFHKTFTALIDLGADLNCIQEGLIPTQYYEKIVQKLTATNNARLNVQFKLTNAQICNKGKCFKNTFILTKDITEEMLLGTPFLTQIYPFEVSEQGIKTHYQQQEILFEFLKPIKQKELHNLKEVEENTFINRISNKSNQITLLQREIAYQRIEEQLNTKIIKEKIKEIENSFIKEVCAEIPNAFWNRKTFTVSLPYTKNFHESNIPTTARPVQMNKETLEYCKKEIQEF